MKSLKDGMVLNEIDRKYISDNLLPFLQELKETTLDYALSGMQGQMS